MRSVGMAIALSCLIGVGATACSGDSGDDDGVDDLPDAGANDFLVSGNIFGTERRPGDFNGLFTNRDNIGSLHVYGLGRSTDGDRFRLFLPSFLPMEAQNGGTVAVGHIVMTEIDDSLPEGRPSSEDGEKVIGVSTQHMLVYRAAPNVTVFSWEEAFPAGWSCGACMRIPNGTDRLTPSSCETMTVDIGTFQTLEACNPFAP